MTYIIVNPAEWLGRITDLLVLNWEETGMDCEFKPSLALYQHLFDSGAVFAVAALDGPKVVGYASVIVVPHSFNTEIKVASCEALFVHPDYRQGMATGRIMKLAEKEAASRGASRFTWRCSHKNDFYKTLINHGYEQSDFCVTRPLNA